jgi:polysaccharide pyruvyl transferase WcaK-like protein
LKKAILFGYNTDSPNWGCRATPNVLRSKLNNKYLIQDVVSNDSLIKMEEGDISTLISKCNAVIINGEGSPIFTTPPRKEFLKHLDIIKISSLQGKRVIYINSMVSDCPVSYRNNDTYNRTINEFNKCHIVSLRDPVSFNLIKGRVKNLIYTPDVLFSFDKNKGFEYPDKLKDTVRDLNLKTAGYIGISGGSWPLMVDHPVDQKIEGYRKLIKGLIKSKNKVLLIETCSADRWLRDLAEEFNLEYVPSNLNSSKFADVLERLSIFISGRFHPSILASVFGIPCIFFESNSHKTLTLQKMLGYENPKSFEFPLSDQSVSEIIRKVIYYRSELEFHSKRILKRVELLGNKINQSKLY